MAKFFHLQPDAQETPPTVPFFEPGAGSPIFDPTPSLEPPLRVPCRMAGLGLLSCAAPVGQAPEPPPSEAAAQPRLETSTRHGEWATVRTGPDDSVVVWMVYPERSGKAPVVVVIPESAGLSIWIRAVADQLAADGFIALAPELLTMRRPGNLMSPWSADSSRAALATLGDDEVHRSIEAVARFGMSLPAAEPRYGVVGFGWGGARAYRHAAGGAAAAVVSYDGGVPPTARGAMATPALGCYGGLDEPAVARLAAADSAIRRLGGPFRSAVYPEAAPGFLRTQTGRDGANLAAARAAWTETLAFLRTHLER